MLVWTASQPTGMVFLVFNTIGVGMAIPYVLLTANPKWLRFVPKPGPWLTTFKEAMGFLLMATVIYLLYILDGQLGGLAVVRSLVFLTGLGLACWIVGTWLTVNRSAGQRAGVMVVALVVAVVSGGLAFGGGFDAGVVTIEASSVPSDTPADVDETELDWVDFSMAKLTELTAEGKTVFLDITARWCPNCKANLAVVFNSAPVAAAVEQYGVVPMLADWTARGPVIEALIDKLSPGASIPICAVFPAGRPTEPVVMLGMVSRQQVIDAFREAAGVKPLVAR